jgi:hypothetical protein
VTVGVEVGRGVEVGSGGGVEVGGKGVGVGGGGVAVNDGVGAVVGVAVATGAGVGVVSPSVGIRGAATRVTVADTVGDADEPGAVAVGVKGARVAGGDGSPHAARPTIKLHVARIANAEIEPGNAVQ